MMLRKNPYAKPPRYTPTPEQIRQACSEIQETWSEEERLQRAGLNRPTPWNVPVVRISKNHEGIIVATPITDSNDIYRD